MPGLLQIFLSTSSHLIDGCQTSQFLSPPHCEQFQVPGSWLSSNTSLSALTWRLETGMVGGSWLGYLDRRRGRKSTKKYRSCGDLRIYPIREIRGNNRIIYGDQFDDDDRENKTRTENVYFIRSDEFHHEILIPAQEYSEINEVEPFYCEISTVQRYEKLYHFSSQPSIHTSHSESGDSGYRSVSQVITSGFSHSSSPPCTGCDHLQIYSKSIFI